MTTQEMTPDLAALVAAIESEMEFAQVLIRRAKDEGFELRHAADRSRDSQELRALAGQEIRRVAQFSASGAFRPLKSAPNLAGGWRILARDARALGDALSQLYPGAVADWFAAQSPSPPITSYRQFTARQTGMYRITTLLDDATGATMTRACCHQDFCLKRRLWTVEGAERDGAGEKSVIPCLEPCAILLEFARKVARWEQQAATEASAPPEIQPESAAECDFDAPHNPRRRRYFTEKNRSLSH